MLARYKWSDVEHLDDVSRSSPGELLIDPANGTRTAPFVLVGGVMRLVREFVFACADRPCLPPPLAWGGCSVNDKDCCESTPQTHMTPYTQRLIYQTANCVLYSRTKRYTTRELVSIFLRWTEVPVGDCYAPDDCAPIHHA